MIPSKLEKIIKEKISSNFIDDINLFTLTPPPSYVDKDASTNFALIVSKKRRLAIDDIYQVISKELSKNGFISELKSGFINIKFPQSVFEEYINEFLSHPSLFKREENKDKKIIIEFVSANPTGPLHLASASGASLGDSISNILKELGYSVFKEYYVNDTGNQIELLGRSLLARYLNREPPEDGYHGEYLIEISKRLPPQAKEWALKNEVSKFSDFAMKEIISQQQKDLELFGVEFDNWFYESTLHREKLQEKVLEILKKLNAIEEKDGALWLKTEDENDKERVLVKSNGAKTYFLNDLAYHMSKYQRGFDQIIDIWGADHHGYIPRMKYGIKMLGFDETKFIVIIHQLVSLKKDNEIIKMSKRSGNFYTLRRLIEETSKDAVRFFFTARSPDTHLIFDIDLARRQSNENPLYYVNYAHARISSVFENAKKSGFNVDDINSFGSYTLNSEERIIVRKIFWFEKVIYQCYKDLSPHHIPSYIIDLASTFHSYYEKNKIIDTANRSQTVARLFLLKGVKETIKRALSLIGVKAIDHM